MTDLAATRMSDGGNKRVCSTPRGDAEARPLPALSPSMRDRLVRLAYRFLWNLDDAEDTVQEALATAHQRAGNLRERDKWWSWVCRIVVQRCHLHGRDRQRRRSHQEPYEREVLRRSGDSAPADSPRGTEALREALGKLPRRQQEVIVLRHLQGMAYGQIGEVLDIAPATARVHARAGREALRDHLLQHDPELFERRLPRGGEG